MLCIHYLYRTNNVAHRVSRAETASIFSIGSLAYGFASPLAGFMFDRLGPRKLFSFSALLLLIGTIGASCSLTIFQLSIFFGIFIAVGTTCAGFVPNSALISNWFMTEGD